MLRLDGDPLLAPFTAETAAVVPADGVFDRSLEPSFEWGVGDDPVACDVDHWCASDGG